jgi:hypothetical protein
VALSTSARWIWHPEVPGGERIKEVSSSPATAAFVTHLAYVTLGGCHTKLVTRAIPISRARNSPLMRIPFEEEFSSLEIQTQALAWVRKQS